MKIGDKYTFCPSAFTGKDGKQGGDGFQIPHKVEGTVDYINLRHHWCNVRYECFGNVLHEGFKIRPLHDRIGIVIPAEPVKIPEPEGWGEIFEAYTKRNITAAEAVLLTGMKRDDFITLVRLTRIKNKNKNKN